MTSFKITRTGSRRWTALLIALALMLGVAPCAFAQPSADEQLRTPIERLFLLDWSLHDVFSFLFGTPEPIRSVTAKGRTFIDPDGQSLHATDTERAPSNTLITGSIEL